MRFASYLLNIRRPFPYRYWVNRFLTALPGSSPHIQFLCVRLTIMGWSAPKEHRTPETIYDSLDIQGKKEALSFLSLTG